MAFPAIAARPVGVAGAATSAVVKLIVVAEIALLAPSSTVAPMAA